MRFIFAAIIERLSHYSDYATAWTTRMLGFTSQQGQDSSLLHGPPDPYLACTRRWWNMQHFSHLCL